jgi:hypothetical protein
MFLSTKVLCRTIELSELNVPMFVSNIKSTVINSVNFWYVRSFLADTS